jgi:hypothetical protein
MIIFALYTTKYLSLTINLQNLLENLVFLYINVYLIKSLATIDLLFISIIVRSFLGIVLTMIYLSLHLR